jgi:uncharacterized protein YciI
VVDLQIGNGSGTERARKVHAEPLHQGSMKLAGPLTDNAGGAVLLEVSDEAEKAMVANDPAVKSGIFVYEMHPWKLQPWDQLTKS